MTDGSPRYAAPAAACAADVLKALASAPEPLTVAELARRVERSKSLVYRVTRELEAGDLIVRRDLSRYGLSLGIMELAGALIARSDDLESARAALRELADRTGETANLGVLRAPDVLYVIKHEGRNSVLTISHVGARIPATCSALGKALLAQLTDDEAVRAQALPMRRLTSRSISTMPALLEALATTRAQGYATEEGEAILGRCCLATGVELQDAYSGPAAISISVAEETYRAGFEGLRDALLHARDRIERTRAARGAMTGV